jgi:hypothetical protein
MWTAETRAEPKHAWHSCYREGERSERGEATLDEAAETLKVSRATAYRMVTSDVCRATRQTDPLTT